MRMLDKVAMAAMVMLLGAAAQAQPVYKWVDADGKTHYGSQPPPTQQDAAPMKLQNNNGTSGSGGAGSKSNSGAASGKSADTATLNPDGTKKIPKDVEEFVQGAKKALEKVDSNAVPLNCAKAVDNIQYQADQMLEAGQKNVRDGYMAKADFDKVAPKIREARGKYSVSDCQGASGNKKSFYQCMSSSNNHVMGCDKQYKH